MSIDQQKPVPVPRGSNQHWSHLVREGADWAWHGAQFVQVGALPANPGAAQGRPALGSLIVKFIYGRQNRAAPVRRALAAAISRLSDIDYGLNFGSGHEKLGGRMITLDVCSHGDINIVSNGALEIPLKDESLELVVTQEVLEHVHDPYAALAEFHRVLKPGGELLLQLPFIIGYHPGPTDFWRFSKEAYAVLLPPDKWEISSVEISVGHGTGFYRISCEFVAVHFSVFGRRAYRAVKGMFSVLFSPLILFDVLTPYLPEKDRIPGGYVVLAKCRKS